MMISRTIYFVAFTFAAAGFFAWPKSALAEDAKTSLLTIRLVDADSGRPVTGIVRLTDRVTGQFLKLPELIQRKNGWYTAQSVSQVSVPQADLTIEALRGLQTKKTHANISAAEDAEVTLKLETFYDSKVRGWRNGNTHLHLMKQTRRQAEQYLKEVPASDGLELVYLSHLRRIPDEKDYISNEIIEQNWTRQTLKRLSSSKVLFRPGEEHRHNLGRGGEGYGHVMLLDIKQLIRPVSIGPGIMRSGTDAPPLQAGIVAARQDGATVIWCHNTNGFEDIPNWLASNIHAQNIFDGGSRGTYADSFYRYLNLGMRVPFSTGTDWFIDDFSRVYVPLVGDMDSDRWLTQLRAGRTYITNGPLLEFTVEGKAAGHVFDASESRAFTVKARSIGRVNFGALELIRDGHIIHRQNAELVNGVHTAEINTQVTIDEASWLAVRIPPGGKKNEFGRTLFAHSSPVYVDHNGRRRFDRETAFELIEELEESLQVIRANAMFTGEDESLVVREVYEDAIRILRERIEANRR